MKRLVVVATVVVAMLGVVACSSQTAGTPTPGTSAGGQPSSAGPSGGASPSTADSGSLATENPCSLLSSSDLQKLGATSTPTSSNVGGAPNCDIPISHGSIGAGYIPDQGLSQLVVVGPVTDLSIGSHQAKRMQPTSDDTSCYMAIGLTSSTRYDVSVETETAALACPTAMKVAQLVEPKLPPAG